MTVIACYQVQIQEHREKWMSLSWAMSFDTLSPELFHPSEVHFHWSFYEELYIKCSYVHPFVQRGKTQKS